MDRVQGVNSPGMLRPSLEIKALHNLIGRYWNGIVPPDSMMSGANMPIVQYLHEHRDSDVFQYDIERAFSITRSTASRVLGLMEKKGLITRSAVDWDARVRKIELTPTASDLVVEIMRAAHQLETTLFTGFTRTSRNGSWTTLPACVPIWWRPGLSAPSARRLSRPHVPGKTPHTSSRKEMRQHEHYHGN